MVTAWKPALHQRFAGLHRIATLLVHLGGIRGDLLLGKGANGLAQRLVLVTEPVGVEIRVHEAELNGTACHKTSSLLPFVP